MEPLIDADYEKRGYRGILAESWQMKGTKLQFKLRKGIRFHDGTPFTSRDVLASFKRILTDKQSLQAPNLQNIAEMDAPDDHTVILTLKKADANALEDINSRVDHETVGGGKNGRGGQSADRNRSIQIYQLGTKRPVRYPPQRELLGPSAKNRRSHLQSDSRRRGAHRRARGGSGGYNQQHSAARGRAI